MAKCTFLNMTTSATCDEVLIAWKHEGHRLDPSGYPAVETALANARAGTPEEGNLYGDIQSGFTNLMCEHLSCSGRYQRQSVAD